jgi:uncharacterized protein YcbK (DUF882 family)
MAGESLCPLRLCSCAGLATVLFLVGCESLQNASANGDTRTLTMHHMHTGEDITITYKREGRYDDAALEKLNWFLRDWRRQEQTHMDPHLLDLVWEANRDVGGTEPIQIVCGYRSPQTNAMLRRRSRGVAQSSQHMQGRAMDFYIPGVPLEELRYAGLRLQRGGVGYYPTSGSPFVHLDTGRVRHWPRMSDQQLARVLSDRNLAHHRPRAATTKVASAAHDGDEDASAPATERKPKRGLIAKLFGFGEDGDADAAEGGSRGDQLSVSGPQPTPAPTVRPVQIVAALPLPPPRPVRPAAQFELASAPTPPADSPAPAPDMIGVNGQRLVWQPGPQGRPAIRPPAAVEEQPQLLQGADLAAASPDTAVGLAAVPAAAIRDRVPAEVAFAYAASPPPDIAARSVPPATTRAIKQAALPAAALAPTHALPAAITVPRSTVATPSPRAGQSMDDPWLRGVVMAPSVHYSMSVSILGAQNYRYLRTFIYKPPAAVAMAFNLDPYSGMTSQSFDGPAISFVQTITFSNRTASLE